MKIILQSGESLTIEFAGTVIRPVKVPAHIEVQFTENEITVLPCLNGSMIKNFIRQEIIQV